jgi:hypothetical protein
MRAASTSTMATMAYIIHRGTPLSLLAIVSVCSNVGTRALMHCRSYVQTDQGKLNPTAGPVLSALADEADLQLHVRHTGARARCREELPSSRSAGWEDGNEHAPLF